MQFTIRISFSIGLLAKVELKKYPFYPLLIKRKETVKYPTKHNFGTNAGLTINHSSSGGNPMNEISLKQRKNSLKFLYSALLYLAFYCYC